MQIDNCWEQVSKLISSGNVNEAIAICESVPCSKLLKCQKYLGWSYYDKGDMERALTWFSKAGDQEDGEALFGLGSVHVARKEFQIALQYFERAASHGYVRGYQWIAGIYQHGCGVPIDINKATSYYQKGADRGYLMAKRSLISLASQNGNILVRICSQLKLISLQIEAVKIAYLNINDPRLADIQLRKKD